MLCEKIKIPIQDEIETSKDKKLNQNEIATSTYEQPTREGPEELKIVSLVFVVVRFVSFFYYVCKSVESIDEQNNTIKLVVLYI